MTVSIGNVRVLIHVSFAALVMLCFLFGSAKHLAFGFLFAALHELGHLVALACFRAFPSAIQLTAAGVCIQQKPCLHLSFQKEVLIAAAGPAMNVFVAGGCLALGLWREEFFLFFWMNLGLALWNLLPVRQLDGGRMLYYSLCRTCSETTARRVLLISSLVVLFLTAIAAVFLCFRKDFRLVVPVIYLIFCV